MSQQSDTYTADHHFRRSYSFGRAVARRLEREGLLSAFGIAPPPPNATSVHHYTVECVLANVFNVNRTSSVEGDELPWICYSRSKDDYQSSEVYGKLSYSALITTVDQMVAAGFLEHELGVRDVYRSRMRPTQKLWDAAAQHLNVVTHAGTRFLIAGKHSSNKLDRASLPRLVDSRHGLAWARRQGDNQTKVESVDRRVSALLKAMNERTLELAPRLGGGLEVDALMYRQVQIITPDGFNVGGRTYADFQNTSFAERASWTINGEACVEVDISASHTAIFYSLVCAEPPAEPYALHALSDDANVRFRPLIKKVVNIAINCKNDEAARKAIVDFVEGHPADRRRRIPARRAARLSTKAKDLEIVELYDDFVGQYGCELTPNAIKSKKVPSTMAIGKMISMIRETHAPIAQYFCSNAGVVAMGYEGKLSLAVMARCGADETPCLNIHDGFVCQKSRVDYVRQVVSEELAKMGIKAVLKVKTFSALTDLAAVRDAATSAAQNPMVKAEVPDPEFYGNADDMEADLQAARLRKAVKEAKKDRARSRRVLKAILEHRYRVAKTKTAVGKYRPDDEDEPARL